MSRLSYKIGYIDLNQSIDSLFSALKTRTEIRKAEKSGVTIKIFNYVADEEIYNSCSAILKNLLKKEYVPYSSKFDKILRDKTNILLVAFLNNKVASFVVVSPEAKWNFFKDSKSAYLELSGTDDKYKNLCPNYLLIWESIKFLKNSNFNYFNLGLLDYDNCPDPDLEKVSFFKKKWGIKELSVNDDGGLMKFIYYKYFKRFRLVKIFLYYIKKICKNFGEK